MDDARANLFGTLAVKAGLATREQVEECLRAQQEARTTGGPIPRLGEVMAEKGYLSREQVDAVLSGEFAVPGKRFGEMCVQMSFCTAPEVQSAIAEQKRLRSEGSARRIGEILLEQEAIQPHQLPAVLSAQGFEIAECTKCRLSYNVAVDAPASALKCARCGKDLIIVTGYEDIDGSELAGDIVPPGSPAAGPVVPEVLAAEELVSAGSAAPGGAPQAGSEIVEEEEISVQELMGTPPPAGPPGAAGPAPVPLQQRDTVREKPISLAPAEEAGKDAEPALARRPAVAPGGAPLEEAPEEIPDEEEAPLFGEFRVIQKIGEDALGTLYQAESTRNGQAVALKVIDPERTRDREFMERFVAETKRASTLNHPNLKRVVAAGRDKGCLYYASEFMKGRSVRQIMGSKRRMGPAAAVRIALAVAEGLRQAHSTGIYHGDIRPSYIIVSPEGEVKLAECGVAKNIRENCERLVQRHGVTPFYLAPELAAPRGVPDARGDVYELGASLFHMVTGRPPFEGNTPLQIFMRMAEEDPPLAHETNPQVPAGLGKVIRRMMAPRIRDRFQGMDEVARVLGRLLPA